MATKIDSDKLKQLLTPELDTLVNVFKRHNYEIRIAGGAVRDMLMGSQIPDDIDFATTATPTEMKKMFDDEGIRMINMQVRGFQWKQDLERLRAPFHSGRETWHHYCSDKRQREL